LRKFISVLLVLLLVLTACGGRGEEVIPVPPVIVVTCIDTLNLVADATVNTFLGRDVEGAASFFDSFGSSNQRLLFGFDVDNIIEGFVRRVGAIARNLPRESEAAYVEVTPPPPVDLWAEYGLYEGWIAIPYGNWILLEEGGFDVPYVETPIGWISLFGADWTIIYDSSLIFDPATVTIVSQAPTPVQNVGFVAATNTFTTLAFSPSPSTLAVNTTVGFGFEPFTWEQIERFSEPQLIEWYYPDGFAPDIETGLPGTVTPAFRSWFLQRTRELGLLDPRVFQSQDGWAVWSDALIGDGPSLRIFENMYTVSPAIYNFLPDNIVDDTRFDVVRESFAYFDGGFYQATYITNPIHEHENPARVAVRFFFQHVEGVFESEVERYAAGVFNVDVRVE
jgi:hypothetical protein